MYLDPPYPGNGANYLHNMRDWNDHALLEQRLKQTQCQWILSSYDSPEVHALFGDYHFSYINAASGMSDRKGGTSRVQNREVLITNFEPIALRNGEETLQPDKLF